MKKTRFISGLIGAFIFLIQPILAQSPDYSGFNRLSLGIHGGVLTPFTDIEHNRYFPALYEFSIGGGIQAEYHFTPVFALRGAFLLGELKARDRVQKIHFETELWDANTSGVLSLTKLLSPSWKYNNCIDVYGLLGVGLVSYRSKYFDSLNNEVINSFGYSDDGSKKTKRLVDLAIPVGLGARLNLSPRVDLALEMVYRFTQTDKLDALHRHFSRYDAYNFTSLGLIFKLGKNTRSMKWVSPSVVMYPGDTQRMDYITEKVDYTDRRIDQLEEKLEQNTYEPDIEDLRQQIRGIDKKQNDLERKLISMLEPKAESQVLESSVAALLSVYFQLNSAAVDNYNYERVASIARFLRANPETKIELVGHADITGPSAYNLKLSEKRAQAVYDILVHDFRIDSDRLRLSYRGPDDPLSQQNLSINRRVDFIIISK